MGKKLACNPYFNYEIFEWEQRRKENKRLFTQLIATVGGGVLIGLCLSKVIMNYQDSLENTSSIQEEYEEVSEDSLFKEVEEEKMDDASLSISSGFSTYQTDYAENAWNTINSNELEQDSDEFVLKRVIPKNKKYDL